MYRILLSFLVFISISLFSFNASAGEKSYGVIIANKSFNKVRELSYAHNDFAAAKTFFKDILKVPERNLITLEDNVTFGEFIKIFGLPGGKIENTKLFRKIQDKDAKVYIYLITHGMPVLSGKKVDGYFILKDTDPDPAFISSTAYSRKDLFAQLNKIKAFKFPAGKITMFIESCFSGKTDSLQASGPGSLIEGVSAPAFGPPKLSKADDIKVISAARSDQYAVWDRKFEHSVFTRSLVLGASGEADKKTHNGNGDGKVTAKELDAYLQKMVSRGAARNKQFNQTPEMTGFSSEEVFIKVPEKQTVWSKVHGWKSAEDIKAQQLLASTSEESIKSFIETCEFCPQKDKLSKKVRTLRVCEAEKAVSQALLINGTIEGIQKHIQTCKCCSLKKRLQKRMAELELHKDLAVKIKQDNALWEDTLLDSSYHSYLNYIKTCDHCAHKAAAYNKIRNITGPKIGHSFKDCENCPEMVVIPAGSFMMGSSEAEEGAHQSEWPNHPVTIEKPIAVGRFEVTFNEWDACVKEGGCKAKKHADSKWGRNTRPVINLSWHDASQYVAWLRKKTGENYRLLTETEWEYAQRAGSKSRFSFGNDEARLCEYANAADKSTISVKNKNLQCADGFADQTAPVGSFKPNDFGLYDMSGNVWEWVADCWHSDYTHKQHSSPANASTSCKKRVLRGGSWAAIPRGLRSAFRAGIDASYKDNDTGFRIARDLQN